MLFFKKKKKVKVCKFIGRRDGLAVKSTALPENQIPFPAPMSSDFQPRVTAAPGEHASLASDFPGHLHSYVHIHVQRYVLK